MDELTKTKERIDQTYTDLNEARAELKTAKEANDTEKISINKRMNIESLTTFSLLLEAKKALREGTECQKIQIISSHVSDDNHFNHSYGIFQSGRGQPLARKQSRQVQQPRSLVDRCLRLLLIFYISSLFRTHEPAIAIHVSEEMAKDTMLDSLLAAHENPRAFRVRSGYGFDAIYYQLDQGQVQRSDFAQ